MILLFPDTPIIDGPIIIPQKSEIIIQNGANYTLICKGNKDHLQFKQQEILDSITHPFEKNERTISSSDDEYGYEIALDLINVNEFAVGYYACFDDTVNPSDVLKEINEEPVNTEHISYIYVYVNGEVI